MLASKPSAKIKFFALYMTQSQILCYNSRKQTKTWLKAASKISFQGLGEMLQCSKPHVAGLPAWAREQDPA